MKLWVVAEFTLREAARRRVVLAASLVTAGFLTLYGVGLWFGYRDVSTDPNLTNDERQAIVGVMLIGGMWCLNSMASMLAIFLAVASISGEIDQGTMHSLAARPLRRVEIVLGKFVGNLLMLAAFVGISSTVMIVTVALITGQLPDRGWLAPGLMILAAAVLVSITLAASSRFGTLSAGVIVFTLYATALAGGVIEQIGLIIENPVTFDLGILTSVLLPTRALWDLASTQLAVSGPATGALAGPFGTLNPPSVWAVLLAVTYMLVMLSYALWSFERRDI